MAFNNNLLEVPDIVFAYFPSSDYWGGEHQYLMFSEVKFRKCTIGHVMTHDLSW